MRAVSENKISRNGGQQSQALGHLLVNADSKQSGRERELLRTAVRLAAYWFLFTCHTIRQVRFAIGNPKERIP